MMITVQTHTGQVFSYQIANTAEWLVNKFNREETQKLIANQTQLMDLIDHDNAFYRDMPDAKGVAKGAVGRPVFNQAIFDYLVNEYSI